MAGLRIILAGALLGSALPVLVAQEGPFARFTDGQELAAELRSLIPAEPAHYQGALKMRPRSGPMTAVPVVSKMTLGPASWQSIYETEGAGSIPAQTFIAVHAPGQDDSYLYGQGQPCEPRRVAGSELDAPFAGSDFWLADLGLEFLHWPQQKILKAEMRKGRPAKVLESRPAPSAKRAYARVVSWIDNETGGVIMAEAYDGQGKLLKEFEVKSCEKVQGRWHLREMTIRNIQTRSRTWLEFDVQPEEN